MPHKERPVFIRNSNPAALAAPAVHGLGVLWFDGSSEGQPPGA